jgi:NhaP-type Na+/H+ or K+/H+ antiporter
VYEILAIFAAFVFLYSITAGGIARTWISGAIVYSTFGWIMGPHVLDILNISVDAEGLRTLAELTLAMVLFTDASNADLAVLKRYIGLPQRLLLLGLPLTIALGFGVGYGLLDTLSVLELAILATMLAPTDAALGAAVVSDERVPARIRQGLNLESGLNDGICVPILFLFLALATEAGQETSGTGFALDLFAQEIGIGLLVGLVLAYAGTKLLRLCEGLDWITEVWKQLPVAALALGTFALAQLLGGSGFIAAFTGGMLFGALSRSRKQEYLEAAEGVGETLGLVTWVFFGFGVIGHTAVYITWQVVIYAVLSLTLIRMLPVFLVLAGSGLSTGEKLFVGWFGPRGLATVVFAVIVLAEELPGSDVLRQTVVATIVLSIVLHGLTANPLVARLARSGAKTGAPDLRSGK